MATSGPLRVVGVDHAIPEGGDSVFDKARFVEGVGVNGNLDVFFVRHRKAVVDGRGGSAPVLMQFEGHGPGGNLLGQWLREAGVALAHESQVHRQAITRLQHLAQIPGPWGTGRGLGASCRARAPAEHGGDPGHQRFLDQLRADEVDVGIDTASGEDMAFTGNGFGAGTDDDVDSGLGVGIARFADSGDVAIADAHIGFHDAPVVDDQRVRDH